MFAVVGVTDLMVDLRRFVEGRFQTWMIETIVRSVEIRTAYHLYLIPLLHWHIQEHVFYVRVIKDITRAHFQYVVACQHTMVQGHASSTKVVVVG